MRIVNSVGKTGRYFPPPLKHLRRLEAVAMGDIAVARIVLGLFDAILGVREEFPFPDYAWKLSDLKWLPVHCRRDAQMILEWGGERRIVLNELMKAKSAIVNAVVRLRRSSPFGKSRIRIANTLRKKHPPLKPDGRPTPFHPQSLAILSDEVGRPLGPGTIRRLQAFSPSQIEIRKHREPYYATYVDRAAYINLRADGYTIERVTMVLEVEKTPAQTVISGVLEDFFETGTEGVVWSVYDEDERGYDGLHMIEQGDHLTILDSLGNRIWSGTIRCDRKTGWRPYRDNPEYGQPCALGYNIHWTQKGFKPDDWARFFIRPKQDRLRGVLRKHNKSSKSAPV